MTQLTDRLAPHTTLGDVQRVWVTVVGEPMAAHASPVAEREGVLTVVCDASTWAEHVQLMESEIVPAVNAALGRDALRSLRCRATPVRRGAGG
jgi:predicted nucleic acid-binding Zn ribbon protein